MAEPLTPVERFAAEMLENGSTYARERAAAQGLAKPDGDAPFRVKPYGEGERLIPRLKAAREDEEIATLRERLQTLESARRLRDGS